MRNKTMYIKAAKKALKAYNELIDASKAEEYDRIFEELNRDLHRSSQWEKDFARPLKEVLDEVESDHSRNGHLS